MSDLELLGARARFGALCAMWRMAHPPESDETSRPSLGSLDFHLFLCSGGGIRPATFGCRTPRFGRIGLLLSLREQPRRASMANVVLLVPQGARKLQIAPARVMFCATA